MMRRKIISIFALLLSLTVLFGSCVAENPEGSAETEETENLQELEETLPQEETEPVPTEDFIINKNTLKFHYPSCQYVGMMLEENKLFVTSTYNTLVGEGYSPCNICQH